MSSRLAVRILAPLAVVGGVAFWRTADQVGAGVAFDVLIGAESTADKATGWWAPMLAAVGYLGLPTIVSILLGEFLVELIRRDR